MEGPGGICLVRKFYPSSQWMGWHKVQKACSFALGGTCCGATCFRTPPGIQVNLVSKWRPHFSHCSLPSSHLACLTLYLTLEHSFNISLNRNLCLGLWFYRYHPISNLQFLYTIDHCSMELLQEIECYHLKVFCNLGRNKQILSSATFNVITKTSDNKLIHMWE